MSSIVEVRSLTFQSPYYNKIAKEKPIEVVKRSNSMLEANISKSIGNFSQKPGVKKIKKAYRAGTLYINEKTVGLSEKVLTTIRSVVAIGQQLFNHASFVAKAIQVTRLFVLAAVPFVVFNLTVGTRDLIFGTKSEKVDAALMMTAEVGSLGDSAATLAVGLELTGAICEISVWEAPLVGVGAALSAAAIIAHCKGWYESHRFLKSFLTSHGLDKTKEYSSEDIQKAFEFLQSQDSRFLQKHFKVDGDKLKERIRVISLNSKNKLVSSDEKERVQGKSKLNHTLKLLKDRIKVKNWSHALAITAAVICIISTVVLLCSPLAPIGVGLLPVGYALLALSGSISIGKFGFELAMKRRFNKAMSASS